MTTLKDIAKLIKSIKDPQLIEAFLREILTPSEQKAICQRWTIVGLLHKGISQREIASTLGTSLCSITRGSRELKNKNSAFLKLLQKKG
jgi:TrpR family transcriptional regulator, trp operon repressor